MKIYITEIIILALFYLGFSNDNIVISETDLKGVSFIENRVLIDVITDESDTLTFFTDTGGGKILFPEAVEKIGIEIDTIKENEEILEVVDLSRWLINRGLPGTKGEQYVYRGPEQMGDASAGILGANWFADKAWNFNYSKGKLSIVDSINWGNAQRGKIEPLYFLKDSTGTKVSDFPRLAVVIEKDTLQMLFDTGATLALNEVSRAYFGTEVPLMGTSFINESIFKKWQEEHPEWNVIEGGEMRTNSDLIEVPHITIGNHTVGPVWFVSRPDENFSGWMSQWMDREIQGAIGGSAFQHFDKIIVDYNAERAAFYKAEK